jgi:hypothetical protein
MGIGKWMDADSAKELFPDKADEIDAGLMAGSDLTSNSDRDNKWFAADGDIKRIRLVDIWYKHKGEWCWCIFTGAGKMMEGQSYLKDEKQKTICKFLMFSAAVDHDGDRYGFVRNLRSANDEINQRRSKGLHELNSRRIIAEKGAFDDIEGARREMARPDGVIERNPGMQAEFDDQARLANIEGAFKFLEDAKAEIENFGPNPALIGQSGIQNRSGRAIALLQQAGIAELGPYILAYRGWKIRVYRAIWNAVQQHWTAERWIRVTDDDGIAQFLQINGMTVDPMTGMPAIINGVGSLDVDIILDEGPDQVNAMADLHETLQQILPSMAPLLTPQIAQAALNVLVQSSSLPPEAKKQFKDASQQQPDPMVQQAKQIELQGNAAKVDETKSKTLLNVAKAHEAGQPDMPGQPQQLEFELPPDIQVAKAASEINDRNASAEHKRAQAFKASVDASLAPRQTAHQQFMDTANFTQSAFDSAEDRRLARQSAQGS